jgi:hypothetical protein
MMRLRSPTLVDNGSGDVAGLGLNKDLALDGGIYLDWTSIDDAF